MNAHPDDSVIESLAVGALEADDDLLDHVSRCDECAAKLQREAAHELMFMDMAADLEDRRGQGAEPGAEPPLEQAAPAVPSGAPPAGRRSNVRYLAPAALVLAVAAALALWVQRDRARPIEAARGVVTCPDGPEQLACVADAQRAGRRVEYPSLTNIVGSGHGLTAEIRFEPNPPADGFEAAAAPLRQPIADCIAAGLNVQTSAVIQGSFAIRTKVGADGRVTSAGTVLTLRNRRKLPPEMRGLAACVEKVWDDARLTPQRAELQVVTNVHYVWRE